MTNYFVSRIQKDFNNNNTYFGGVLTSTNRDLPENLDFLHKSALTGGLDFKHQWKNRMYYVGSNVVFSNVAGSTNAITNTQQSISHLFQRVDASYLDVDPNKTSLSGTGGNLQFGKASGNWRFETGATWHSPELELNDIGFMRQADDYRHYAWLSYGSTKPLKKLRAYQINYTHLAAFDFGNNLNNLGFNVNGWMNLNNNWFINGGVNYQPVIFSNYALRGGPRLNTGKEFNYRNGITTDNRKKLRFSLNHSFNWELENAYKQFQVSAGITYQPTNALQVSLSPTYGVNDDKLQYVTTDGFNDEARYINAQINQKTLSFPLRIDYIIKPNLSVQFWGQPYISKGIYNNYKYITNSTADNFKNRFELYSNSQISNNNGTYEIDENVDGTMDNSFGQPDFSFIQWRSNLVLRWEYIPGSEVYLVWSQDNSAFGNINDGLIEGLSNNTNKPQNIFLLKATYRFM